MAISEGENLCMITWNPRELRLDDFVAFTSLLVDLYRGVATPYVTSELYQDGSNVGVPGLPSVATVQMGSPLTTELLAIARDEWGIVALGMAGFLLKHPERFGEFLPRIGEAWYNGRTSAREAKENFENRNRKSSFEASGPPIRKFERVYRVRERRIEQEKRPEINRRNRHR